MQEYTARMQLLNETLESVQPPTSNSPYEPAFNPSFTDSPPPFREPQPQHYEAPPYQEPPYRVEPSAPFASPVEAPYSSYNRGSVSAPYDSFTGAAAPGRAYQPAYEAAPTFNGAPTRPAASPASSFFGTETSHNLHTEGKREIPVREPASAYGSFMGMGPPPSAPLQIGRASCRERV